ncbi:MAG: hypothetical protein Roseis2KO_41690 [Roseivirga sp.]
MKEIKKNLFALIESFPDTKDEMIQYDHLRKYGEVFSAISSVLVHVYKTEVIRQWVDEGRLDDLTMFLKSILTKNKTENGFFEGGVTLLSEWLSELNTYSDTVSLHDKLKEMLFLRSGEVTDLHKQMLILRDDISKIEEELTSSRDTKENIDKETQKLVNKKNELSDEVDLQKKKLEELEEVKIELLQKQSEQKTLKEKKKSLMKEVEGIETLKDRVKKLQSQVSHLETELDLQKEQIEDEIAKKQQLEKEVENGLDILKFLDESHPLLQEIRDSISKKNNELSDEVMKISNSLSIYIETDRELAVNLDLNESIISRLDGYKSELSIIDEVLKQRVKEVQEI